MLVGVLVRDDGGSLGVQPCVAVGMIEVPVGVDQVPDWIAAEAVGGFEDSWARCVIPASMKTLPSDPVSTAMFPPDPSKMLTSRRSLCTLIGALAASSRIESTMLRASAKTWLGVSQPPVAANVAEPRQHRQKPRRERKCRCAGVIISSYIRSEIVHSVARVRTGATSRMTTHPFDEGEQVCVDVRDSFGLSRALLVCYRMRSWRP